MKVLGIIAEYNPFHNGHMYHLEKSKEILDCNFSVVIMSGHFVQRGIPASFDKWTRAKMALVSGADLVIELPFAFACQSAEIFAHGAVNILDKTNIIDYLSFGGEHYEINDLYKIASVLNKEDTQFTFALKNELAKGYSFPKARHLAVNKVLNNQNDDILSTPNNILGIEYIRWILKLNSTIKPMMIKRKNVDYNSNEVVDNYASATYIRKIISNSKNTEDIVNTIANIVPNKVANIIDEYYRNHPHSNYNDYFNNILIELLKQKPNDLLEYIDVNEGLENRISRCAYTSENINDLVRKIKTKRYTVTRIQRILCHLLLGYKKSMLQKFKLNNEALYLRVLGFNNNGKLILNKIKENSEIPIITNLSKSYPKLNDYQKEMINYDILATDIYNIFNDYNKTRGKDYINSPILFF